MKRVVIFQYRMLHYRTQLFSKLQALCLLHGIELTVVHGQPTPREAKRNDTAPLANSVFVKSAYLALRNKDLIWQPTPRSLKNSDLYIFMQESRLLSNYPYIFRLRERRAKIAFWGHGRNFQSDSSTSLLERWKKLYTNRVDWWFAYTDETRRLLVANGFPKDRVTVLNNAIDNISFQKELASISAADKDRVRAHLGITSSSIVGIFCGSLYPDKRLDILIDTAIHAHNLRPDFHLVIVGDGPSREELLLRIQGLNFISYHGTRSGIDKAELFSIAHFVLNPGLVGLHVLDAFCAGLPMITLRDSKHSPEIAYLENGQNGVVCENASSDFLDETMRLINDTEYRNSLSSGATESANKYSIDQMVNRFFEGIQGCLSE